MWRRQLQITDDLGHLSRYREVTHEALMEDVVALAAVERLLERIVMRAIDVNRHLLVEQATGEEERTTRLTYGDTCLMLVPLGVHPQAFAEAIAPSVGLRTIIFHDYNDAYRRIVHVAIASCLDQNPRYVAYVLAYLDAE